MSCEMLGWMNHQVGIKIAGRNINNLRYADDTTLMAEGEEELDEHLKKHLDEGERREWKSWQKLRSWHLVPSLHCKLNGKNWTLWQTFLSSKITLECDCSHEIKRRLPLGRKAMTNLDSVLDSRDVTLPTKVHIVKAMAFPVIMYGRRLSPELSWWRFLRVPGLQRDQTSQS